MGLRVLVVDDDQSFQQLMEVTLLLEPTVSDVELAGDGPQAIEVCREFQPDLVFVDSLLPQMTGDEVSEQLRRDFPDVRIVSLSGVQDKNAGPNERLEKSSATVEDVRRVVAETKPRRR
ncbi:MAG TPA: response regulator [Actinomycetota bacterium]|nr:response regulator [Actinomycetota bacterium]